VLVSRLTLLPQFDGETKIGKGISRKQGGFFLIMSLLAIVRKQKQVAEPQSLKRTAAKVELAGIN